MKIILTLFCLFSITLHSFSQNQFLNIAPCNTNQTPSSYTFNWRTPTFTYYSSNDPVLTPRVIQSPFFLSSLTNPNVNEFSLYTVKDFNEADGWALIKSDFGSPSAGIANPYFVLYNRHTAVLRIFIGITQLLNQNNGATINLTYGDGLRTAHLELYGQNQPAFNSLEDFNNNVPEVLIPNYFVNEQNSWFSADFNMSYDPCTCNSKTQLVFEAFLSQSSNLSFTIEGQALQSYNLGEFTDNFGRINSKGSHSSAKGLSSFSPFTFFKNVQTGASYAGSLFTDKWENKKVEDKNKLLQFFNNIETLAKAVNGVQSIIGLLYGSPTTTAQPPLAMNIKMKGEGTISSNFSYFTLNSVNPNSDHTQISSNFLPEYNNGYGIFNLLYTPTVTRTYAYYDEYDYDDYWQLNPIYSFHTSKFQLTSDIKYIINPNAGFDIANSDIQASLIFNGFFGNGNNMTPRTLETSIYKTGCLSQLVVPFSELRDSYSIPTFVEGWTPSSVYLKVFAKLRIAGTTKDVTYVNTFKTNLEYIYDDNYQNISFPEAFPPNLCSTTTPAASDLEIKAVCSSFKYQSKASQYARNTTSIATSSPSTGTEDFKVTLKNNPITNKQISLLIQTEKVGKYDVEVLDLTGKLLSKQFVNITSAGESLFTFPYSTISSNGVLLIRVKNEKNGIQQVVKAVY